MLFKIWMDRFVALNRQFEGVQFVAKGKKSAIYDVSLLLFPASSRADLVRMFTQVRDRSYRDVCRMSRDKSATRVTAEPVPACKQLRTRMKYADHEMQGARNISRIYSLLVFILCAQAALLADSPRAANRIDARPRAPKLNINLRIKRESGETTRKRRCFKVGTS